ncbi:MAG: hypothetical protein KGQ46_05775 [Hyphomicrobiales bacterium]|nr:hypothetical protein [Hyphomicrobiales bacterium]MDE2115671.1 hypothetical protein [Hyphomicrobiales bacterium]
MTQSALNPAPTAALRDDRVRVARDWPNHLGLIAIFAIGLAWLQPSVTLVSDVSWIISLCERLLQGGRLYTDIWEVNPPATVWLYLPFVALAQALGLRPETVINGEVWLLAAAMLGLVRVILAPTPWLARQDGVTLFWLAALILLVLPVNYFGEREHFCVLLILPALALCLRYNADPQATPLFNSLFLQSLAGICAGIAIAIKPPIGLSLALPYLGLCWHQKSLKYLWTTQVLAAAGLLVAYGLAIEYFAPDYLTHMLPTLIAAYLPDRVPLLALLANFAVVAWLLAASLIFLRWRNGAADPASLILTGASLGGLGLYLIQGKGWRYHSLPMLALAALALAFIVARKPRGQRWALAPLLLAIGTLAFSQLWFNDRVPRLHLRAEIAGLAPHPTMLAISGNIAIGHPLVRLSHGTWVSRECSQWAFLAIAHQFPLAVHDPQGFATAHPRLAAIIATEVANLAQDIGLHHPDIILVDRETADWGKLAENWPKVQSQLAHYANRGTYDDVAVLQRITP